MVSECYKLVLCSGVVWGVVSTFAFSVPILGTYQSA